MNFDHFWPFLTIFDHFLTQKDSQVTVFLLIFYQSMNFDQFLTIFFTKKTDKYQVYTFFFTLRRNFDQFWPILDQKRQKTISFFTYFTFRRNLDLILKCWPFFYKKKTNRKVPIILLLFYPTKKFGQILTIIWPKWQKNTFFLLFFTVTKTSDYCWPFFFTRKTEKYVFSTFLRIFGNFWPFFDQKDRKVPVS